MSPGPLFWLDMLDILDFEVGWLYCRFNRSVVEKMRSFLFIFLHVTCLSQCIATREPIIALFLPYQGTDVCRLRSTREGMRLSRHMRYHENFAFFCSSCRISFATACNLLLAIACLAQILEDQPKFPAGIPSSLMLLKVLIPPESLVIFRSGLDLKNHVYNIYIL